MEKTDCFAYRKRRGDGASLCVALTRCYCVEEDCWRLRSHSSGSSYAFCRVRTDGTVGDSGAFISYGVAPAFCI